MSAKTTTLYILAQADTEAIRSDTFMGDEHMVVPVVALVEGVLHPSNSSAPELALASEFGRHPEGWNGRPIVLDHPSINGLKVSANQPKVLQEESFGSLFNTQLDGTKLKSEIWINLARVEELGDDVKNAIEALQSGELTEISTGLFVDVEQRKGTFNGKAFEGIWRNVTPDHLAILPAGVVGACSVEGGCGAPRLNTACGPDCQCQKEGKIMSEPNGDNKPDLVLEDETKPTPTIIPNEEGGFRAFVSRFRGMISFRSDTEVVEIVTNKELSDRDTKTSLMIALKKEGEANDPFIIALFSSSFVYEPDFSGKLLKRDFTLDSKGGASLGSKTIEVRPITEFVPASQHTEENPEMPNDKITQRVDALVANEGTKFTDVHKEWLLTLSEDQLEILEPEAPKAAETPNANEETPVGGTADPPPVEEPVEVPTTKQFLASAPAEIQEVLNEGIALRDQRRGSLVSVLKANKSCDYSEDELKAMSVVNLEKLAKLANVPSFEGQGGGLRTQMDVGDDEVPEALNVFDIPERKTA